MYATIKIILSALIIFAVSETAKTSPRVGALIASLPLISLLGMIWTYVDTRNANTVAVLSSDIFWLVLPSLVLFVALPRLLRHGLAFYPSLALSITLMLAAYVAMLAGLRHCGIGSGNMSW